MDFTELKARLRTSVKNPDLVELPDDICGAYVNSGYLDVSGRYPFHQTRKRCTFDTIIGEERYQLPPDLAAVYRLKNNTLGYKLGKRGDRLIADTLTDRFRSAPRKYVRYRNYVELWPSPDAVYEMEVWYRAVSQPLTDVSPNPVLNPEYHDGIWMRAKWYYFIDKGDRQQAAAADTDYKLWLSDKPSEIDEETRDIENGVELPELTRRMFCQSGRYDDGYFDFRD